MKEIKLFDYQQEMLETITEAFSAAAFDTVLAPRDSLVREIEG